MLMCLEDTPGKCLVCSGIKGREASGECRDGVLRFGSRGSLPRWGLGAEEGESEAVRGGESEGRLPGDYYPEHARKLSRKDQGRRGMGGECNKEEGGLCSMSIFSGTRHPLCVSIKAVGVGAGQAKGPDWQGTD